MKITSNTLPEKLLQSDQIRALIELGAAATNTGDTQKYFQTSTIRQAYTALVGIFAQINEQGATLESGLSHRLMAQAQALIVSGQLKAEQVRTLQGNIEKARPTLAADPTFAEAPTGPAAQILGTGKPTITPEQVPVDITNALLKSNVKSLEQQDQLATSLAGPLRRSVDMSKEMKNAGIFKRLYEGLRKLFQGKDYKAYPIRELEKDLTTWFKQNHQQLGQLSSIVDLDDFGGAVDDILLEAFPKKADDKWVEDAVAVAKKIVKEQFGDAKAVFEKQSKAYHQECYDKMQAIVKAATTRDENASAAQLMQKNADGQDEIARLWQSVDLDRLTPQDICTAMRDLIDAQVMIGDSKDEIIGFVNSRVKRANEMASVLENAARDLKNKNIPHEGTLTALQKSILDTTNEYLAEASYYTMIPGTMEKLAEASAAAKQALDARCAAEINGDKAQSWYREAHESYSHTVEKLNAEKGKTKYKHLTQHMEKAPLVAIEADRILHVNRPNEAKLAWLYDTSRTIIPAK